MKRPSHHTYEYLVRLLLSAGCSLAEADTIAREQATQ
jgi:hypothetical protein